MRLLLDSHTLVWAVFARDRLSPKARLLLEEDGNSFVLSTASLWELSIKVSKGKLPMPGSSISYLARQMILLGIEQLPIRMEHVLRCETLPHLHGDPFDRMIVAQSLEDGIPLLSRDRMFVRYGVTVLWN